MNALAFEQLDFKPHHSGTGVQAMAFYPNGYGASVIRIKGSYGYDAGLYELAVLKGDETNNDLCYDTPITIDVEGHLTETDVTALLKRIAEFPQASK